MTVPTLILFGCGLLLLLYAVYQLAPNWGNGARRRALSLPPPALRQPAATLSAEPVAPRPGRVATWLLARTPHRALTFLIVGGATLAIIVQVWLSAHPDGLGLAFVLLLLCGAITAALLHTLARPSLLNAALAPARALHLRWLVVGGAAAGIVCAAIGAWQVSSSLWTAQLWWLAAMVVPLVALLVERLPAWRARNWRLPPVSWAGTGLVVVLVGIALAMRVPSITASPPYVHGDESACGLSGRQFNAGQTPLLSINWYGLPMLSYAIAGMGMRIFGDNLAGLRLGNAMLGTLSVVIVYWLGRELFGRRAGLLAGLVLALTFLDVDLSRDGIHYLQGPTGTALTLLLVVLWLRRGGALWAFLAGVSMIIDLQLYFAARIAPVLAALLVVYVAVTSARARQARWREAIWVIVGLVVSGAPLAALFLANPGTFSGRQDQVSIFGHDPYAVSVTQAAYGTTAIVQVMLHAAWRIITTFNATGDASLQIGWGGGMLDTVSAALLPAAFFLALIRWRRWQYFLCLIWFGAVVGAGVITIDAPWWPRLAALLPAIALMLGVLLAEGLRVLEEYLVPRYRPVALAALGVLLACMAIGNVRLVFFDYPAAAVQAASMEATYLGRYLAHAPGADQAVLLSDGSMYVDYDVVQFLAPHASGCTLMAGQPLSACSLTRTSRLYVFLPGRDGDLSWLESQRPGGKTFVIGTFNYGASRMLAYVLPTTQTQGA